MPNNFYRVVSITKNVKRYPDSEADTREFPELVARVEDETDLFVVDEHRNAWPADEFFFLGSAPRRFISL